MKPIDLKSSRNHIPLKKAIGNDNLYSRIFYFLMPYNMYRAYFERVTSGIVEHLYETNQ